MSDWIKTTLGDLVTIGRGSSPRPIHDYLSTHGIPWVKIADATSSSTRFINSTKQFIKEEGRSRTVYPGDLIVSNSATPGIPKVMSIEACVHDGWLTFEKYNNIDKWYLFYFFLDFRRVLEHSASGSVFKNLKIDIVRNAEISLPSLNEQKSIADILSSFDDKIELLREQNKTLETLAQTLFKEWFVKFNFPGATGEMINSELGEIPKGWRVGALGEEFEIKIGRTPPRKESEWFSKIPMGLKWASIKDMVNSGVYIFNTSEYITNEAIDKFNIPIIEEDTTILSFKMTVGKLAITTEKMLSNEAIAQMCHLSGNLSSEFIYCYLKNLDFNSLGSTSSIVTAINSRMIKDLKILVPDKYILDKFDIVIKDVFKKIKNNTSQIQSLEKTRDALLPKLMSGNIRVN